MMGCFVCDFDKIEAAHKKAKEPNMSLDGNPLRNEAKSIYQTALEERNMDSLRADARAWNDPVMGHIYRGIFGMTKEEE